MQGNNNKLLEVLVEKSFLEGMLHPDIFNLNWPWAEGRGRKGKQGLVVLSFHQFVVKVEMSVMNLLIKFFQAGEGRKSGFINGSHKFMRYSN